MDELPWLSEQEPSIEGLLQSAWDRQLGRLPILLILIGSDLHMMESLERYDRPLHGRVTPFAIEPLNPAEMSDMVTAEPEAALDAYCILGGFPQLATRRGKDTVRRYLTRELSDSTSPLVVTGERVMAAELPAQSAATSVIATIGAGETEFVKILRRSGVGRTSLSSALIRWCASASSTATSHSLISTTQSSVDTRSPTHTCASGFVSSARICH